MPPPCCLGQRLRPAPRLHHRFFWEFRIQDFLPADHVLAVADEKVLNALVEIGLQSAVAVECSLAEERLDARVRAPLPAVHLVPADVNVRIGKQRRHLAQKPVEELVNRFVRRIQRGIVNTVAERVGPGSRLASPHHIGRTGARLAAEA